MRYDIRYRVAWDFSFPGRLVHVKPSISSSFKQSVIRYVPNFGYPSDLRTEKPPVSST